MYTAQILFLMTHTPQ